MANDSTIDLVDAERDMSYLRSVLLRPTSELLEQQRQEIEALQTRILHLEQLVADTAGRARAVDEVLVEAVRESKRPTGQLGTALQPEIEQAVYASARTEGSSLAEALYPVIGPAVRKMIAAMFTPDSGGNAFTVEQILLIDRSTGLMLASTATDARALDDADVVSGMIDALTTFVQDAFHSSEGDGLQDLRVGDLSLLVETGPSAVLASVVRGIPTQSYRDGASQTLEDIHVAYANEFAHFDGSIDAFDGVAETLGDLHEFASAQSSATSRWSLFAVAGLATVLLALLVLVGALIT